MHIFRTDAGMSSTYAPSLVSLGITSVKSEVNTADEVIFEEHNDNGELDLEGMAYILFFSLRRLE